MCKHLNVTLTEYGTSFTQHEYQGGQVVSHLNDLGDYTGLCEVQCHDCGLSRRFNRSKTKKLPQWLRARLDELGDKHITPLHEGVG